MSARDEILGRVRAGLAKGDAGSRRAAALARLQAHPPGPRPTLAGDLVARFRDKAQSLASTVEQVDDYAAVPARVAAYLASLGLPAQAVTALDVAGLDWAAAGLAWRSGVAVDADPVGISGCFCAIAETGTLMLLSGAATPASVSLLPETHIALVPAARIVATMEDAFALLRAERGALPRAVNFVSGPSRTGDIEQTIVLGAHGPCRVHLIVIGENA
ncbi:LutC/YkgG family protein [Azonexus fungiphilus]|jgi:L-lactate dehydrogenase complex protein LldG|uniref:LutC/YkgG family protein n=1 Tax=Azonexus fungiphilus TaxID=146940 RepID=UPI00156BACEC|nr:lactate utilization protein C [Azonexus fungiphilus]NHC06248.1 lactate utilization protein C [Azonexus fungiphilus]